MTPPKNTQTALIASGVVLGMVGMSFAAVPLYQTFCRVTGWGGTTQVAKTVSDVILDREITIRFDASKDQNLPWSFKPVQRTQTIQIGESGLAFYEATNLSDQPIVGTAGFNVQPAKAGLYFMKVACFCFEEQLLQPGETMKMPITYYIDPELADNPRLDEVREITLSYTFYRDEQAEKRLLTAPDS